MRNPKVEIYKDQSGEWRWRIQSSGRIVGASSEGYSTKKLATKNLESITSFNSKQEEEEEIERVEQQESEERYEVEKMKEEKERIEGDIKAVNEDINKKKGQLEAQLKQRRHLKRMLRIVSDNMETEKSRN